MGDDGGREHRADHGHATDRWHIERGFNADRAYPDLLQGLLALGGGSAGRRSTGAS
jgi:hypothetical protein